MTRVDVVVTCYQHGAFLEAAVRSALDQDGVDVRVTIVDDGSTDGSADVARALAAADARVQAIVQDNQGVAVARNVGIAASDADLFLCLDADDELAPGFLRACVEALDRHPWASYAYCDQQNTGESTTFERHPPYDATLLRRFNYILATAVTRRQAWTDVGGYAPGVGYEDWDFWLGCSERGHHGIHVPEAVLLRRVTATGRYRSDTRSDAATKAAIVLRHPALYGPAEQEWARGVLAGDAVALAQDPGLAVVPKPDALHVLFTMVGWADEGGGTILPRQIAKALVRRGHRVTVLYAPVDERPDLPPYALEASVDDGVRLLALYNRPSRFSDPMNPLREIEDARVARIVEELVDELQPDVAHLHSLLGFSTALPRVLHEAGVPTVYTSHNYWPICPRMYLFRDDLSLCDGPEESGNCAPCLGRHGAESEYVERLEAGRTMLGEHVDRHLAVSHRVRELFARAGHDPSRIHVLHQQPETVEWLWREVGERRAPVERLDRPLRVGFIGSLYPHKGVHVLVRALQTFAPGEVEGHLFGGGAGQYVERLRELDENGVVAFHGGYDPRELPRLLGEVDVICVPSVWEDCAPLVVAEALAARAPVVGSRMGGIPDFVAEGETGFLVPHGRPDELAAALRRFVDEPALLGRMQAAIPAPKGFDAYLDELLDHYAGATADRRARANRVPGARRFAVLAAADDLVADTELLRAYGSAFSADDEATLVVHGASELLPALEAAIASAGLDGEDAPDMMALLDVDASEDLAGRVDAVLAPGSDALELRRQAELRWAA